MRTVSENTASLDTSFDMSGISVSNEIKGYQSQRSCFYEFGVDNNDIIAKMWDDHEDTSTIVAELNSFFT